MFLVKTLTPNIIHGKRHEPAHQSTQSHLLLTDLFKRHNVWFGRFSTILLLFDTLS